jgi:hypothetical protein
MRMLMAASSMQLHLPLFGGLTLLVRDARLLVRDARLLVCDAGLTFRADAFPVGDDRLLLGARRLLLRARRLRLGAFSLHRFRRARRVRAPRRNAGGDGER